MKKIVVIGGGVVGCLSAINLKDKGFQVTILDQSEIGQESSSAAAGILFPLLPYIEKTKPLPISISQPVLSGSDTASSKATREKK